MGHVVERYTYKENINKDKVYRELKARVERKCYEEGGSLDAIRWIDSTICADSQEALEYIESHDKGWYDCLAVRYREIPKTVQPTKKLVELRNRVKDLEQQYYTSNGEVMTKGFKSQYVGCKGCGSKLSTKYLRTNKCPLCGTDMRSDTKLQSLDSLKKRIETARKQLRVEEKAFAEKQKSKAEVFWLVKIEYHQ